MGSPAYGDYPSYTTPKKPARSTADYLGESGLIFNGVYDLDAMGAWGAAIHAAKGHRYLWIISPDHDSTYLFGALDAVNCYRGFSDDPTILPDPTTLIPINICNGTYLSNPAVTFTGHIDSDGVTLHVDSMATGSCSILLGWDIVGTTFPLTGAPYTLASGNGRGGPGTYTLSTAQSGAVGSQTMTANVPGNGLFVGNFFASFVFNPDTNTGHLYMQCIVTAGSGRLNVDAFHMGVWTTTDCDNFTFRGISHAPWINNFSATSSQQQPRWVGTNSWVSNGSDGSGDPGLPGYWTSTDGLRFSFGGSVNQVIGTSRFNNRSLGAPPFTVAGQLYTITNEVDLNGTEWNATVTYALNDRAFVNIGDLSEFTAFVDPDGLTLHVTAMRYGTIGVGQTIPQLLVHQSAPLARCAIASFVSGTLGGIGVYTLTVNQGGAVASAAMSTRNNDQHYYDFASYISLSASNIGHDPRTDSVHWAYLPQGGGNWVTKVAIDAHGNVQSSPPPVRISDWYSGYFPGPETMGVWAGVTVDGFSFALANHGFEPTISVPVVVLEAPYEQGGPLNEEYWDCYYTIVDPVAAANAGPFGLAASCSGGNVLVRWYDISPGHSYRVKRSTTLTGTYTTLGDVTVGQYLDTTATPGSMYYYRVVTLAGGVEQKYNTVSTYVGVYDSFTNAHITRVANSGGDLTTVSEWRIAKFVRLLKEHDKLKNLKIARFAWMGVAQGGGNVISRIFDLGTTWMPRMGDYTPVSGTTTYSATAINGVAPGWVNNFPNSFGVSGLNGRSTSGPVGRFNSIQKWPACTFIASYSKSGTAAASLLSYMEAFSAGIHAIVPGIELSHTAGSPGVAQFTMNDASSSYVVATAPLTSATTHIISGSFDGNTTVTCYVEGVPGTPQTGVLDNSILYGEDPSLGDKNRVITSGCSICKIGGLGSTNSVVGSYIFEDNSAFYNGHCVLGFDCVLTPEEQRDFTQFIRDDINYGLIVDDIQTNYSAHCDGQVLTATWTTSGSPATTLTCNSASPFVSGDTGKYFALAGAGASGGVLGGTLTYVSGNQVTLSTPALTPLSASSQTLEWAHDDTPAFLAFQSARAGSAGPVELRVPGRATFATFASDMFAGIRSLRVIGRSNCAFSVLSGVGGGYQLGGAGQYGNNAHQVLLNSSAAGSTTLTLKNPSDASLLASIISPPCFAVQTGFDTQGYGQPSNQQFYEWPYILSISGTTINLESPLKYAYKATWPLFNPGGPPGPTAELGMGGPSTLYAIDPSWDCDHEYVNIFVDFGALQFGRVNSNGKRITFTGGKSNQEGIYPSQNKIWTTNAYDMSACGSVEMDKLNVSVVVNGGHWYGMYFQSPSPEDLYLENVLFDAYLQSSPKNSHLVGCYFNGGAAFGCQSSGYSTSVYAEACYFSGVGQSQGQAGGALERGQLLSNYTFLGGGLIRYLKTSPSQWGNEGARNFIGTNANPAEISFDVTNVYEDGTYVYIQTNGLDGVPNVPGSSLNVQTHPCPQLTFVACVGCADAVDWSGYYAPAAAPIYSYTRRTFSNWAAQQQSTSWIWGKTVSYTLSGFPGDVPYTGTGGALTLNAAAEFGAVNVSPTGTSENYSPAVDMTSAVQRVILPGSITGAQAGDSLGSAPGAMWWDLGVSPYLNRDISGESHSVWPRITIELVTDQSPAGTTPPPSFPALVLGDYVLDHGLAALAAGTTIYLCNAMPQTYTDVTSFALGHATCSFSSPGPASPSGREVSCGRIYGGVVTTVAGAVVWAVVDSGNSRLLAAGALALTWNLTSGVGFDLDPITIVIPP